MKNRKKTIIICAAALICLIAIVLLTMSWLNGAKREARGKFFAAQTKRSGARNIKVEVSGDIPKDYSWSVELNSDRFEVSKTKQTQDSFSFVLSSDSDEAIDNFTVTCTDADGGIYSRLLATASATGRNTLVTDISFAEEKVIYTPIEGLTGIEIEISDDPLAPALVMVRSGEDWRFDYDSSQINVSETAPTGYEYIETGVEFESPMIVVNELESETQYAVVTPLKAGSSVLRIYSEALAYCAQLEFEAAGDGEDITRMALVSASDGPYDFGGAAEKAESSAKNISGYKLPQGAVVKASYSFDVEKTGEETGIGSGENGVFVQFVLNGTDLGLYMSDKYGNDELLGAVLGDVSQMKKETAGSAVIYSDASAGDRAGCAAVWSSGKTSYVLAGSCSANAMKTVAEGMQ